MAQDKNSMVAMVCVIHVLGKSLHYIHATWNANRSDIGNWNRMGSQYMTCPKLWNGGGGLI